MNPHTRDLELLILRDMRAKERVSAMLAHTMATAAEMLSAADLSRRFIVQHGASLHSWVDRFHLGAPAQPPYIGADGLTRTRYGLPSWPHHWLEFETLGSGGHPPGELNRHPSLVRRPPRAGPIRVMDAAIWDLCEDELAQVGGTIQVREQWAWWGEYSVKDPVDGTEWEWCFDWGLLQRIDPASR